MIQTKVAKIIDPTLIVLASGSEDGVREGMEFVIFTLGDIILDPETGDNLGQLELVKGRVVAAHVQDRLTIARTKLKRVRIEPLAVMWRKEFTARDEEVQEKLPVESTTVRADRVLDTVVRVGDKVRSVVVPEFALEKS